MKTIKNNNKKKEKPFESFLWHVIEKNAISVEE